MKLAAIGEFGLIERIKRIFPSRGVDVVTGIGDDAAIVKSPRPLLALTVDTLAENVHFDFRYTSWQSLGWKAGVASLSDVAAMGGWPRFALVSLALPKNISLKSIEEFYRGLGRLAKKYRFSVVGGDTVRAPGVMINVTVVGEVEKPLLRSGARAGDLIMVTGDLGASAAGLALLESKGSSLGFARDKRVTGRGSRVIKRHLWPRPRLEEGRILREVASSLIDSSDGLARSVKEITRASGVGAKIFLGKIPVSPAVKSVAKRLGKSPFEFSLFGGEDFELVFTVRPPLAKKLADLIRRKTGTQVTVVGEIVRKGISVVTPTGQAVALQHFGYDAFKAN